MIDEFDIRYHIQPFLIFEVNAQKTKNFERVWRRQANETVNASTAPQHAPPSPHAATDDDDTAPLLRLNSV